MVLCAFVRESERVRERVRGGGEGEVWKAREGYASRSVSAPGGKVTKGSGQNPRVKPPAIQNAAPNPSFPATDPESTGPRTHPVVIADSAKPIAIAKKDVPQ